MTYPTMILAAGFGTRMGALTAGRSKPLIEVQGRPLLDHAIAVAGDGPVVVNAHYRAAQMAEYLARNHPGIVLSEEQPDILESGGGLKQALPLLGASPAATLNADVVWSGPGPLSVLDGGWDGDRMGALLLLVPQDRAVGRQGGGDFAMGADGRLTWDKGPDGLIYTGAQIIDTGPVRACPDRIFSLRVIWQDLMDLGLLYGVIYPGRWADVGHPDGIALAEGMLRDD